MPQTKKYRRTKPNRKRRYPGSHFVTPPQSMKITGFGLPLTYQLLKEGTMPGTKLKSHWLIPRDELLAWLKSIGKNESAA